MDQQQASSFWNGLQQASLPQYGTEKVGEPRREMRPLRRQGVGLSRAAYPGTPGDVGDPR